MKLKTWTDNSIKNALTTYKRYGIHDAAKRLKISIPELNHLVSLYVHEKNNKRWSKDDVNYLKKKYINGNMYEMSKKLNRTESSIHMKANRLGLVKKVKTMPKDRRKAFEKEENKTKN